MKKYSLLLAMVLLSGCGSDDSGTPANNTGASIKVNILGAWEYLIQTRNSICDGLLARGTITIQALPSDTTKIGNILLSGDGYDVDQFGNCFITEINETNPDWIGRPAEMTADEYLAFIQQDNEGDNTIQSVRLDAFNDSKIVEVETYTNTVVITTTATR